MPIEMSSVASAVTVAPSNGQQLGSFHCVACGREQTSWRPVLRSDPARRPFDLLRCAGCGLVQQYPRYTTEQALALYDEDYYVFAEDEACRWARAVQQYAVNLARWETAHYRRMLDVGCALGHLSALAGRRGWHVVGMDMSPEAVSRAAVRFGHDFRGGTLAQHRDTLPPFDLVFLGDVIEHVPGPAEFLREVRQVLAPDGMVCIDTPNWASPWRRWGRGHWVGLNRFHINLFTADSLAALLRSCGFVDIETGSYTHYRYESWANRPEPQAIVQKMPALLAWRINRFLSRRSRRKPWAMLRENPPTTLDEACRMLSGLPPAPDHWNDTRHSGDNLIAAAW